jgi:riboflavin kinase/FMN adenylyltransferase
VKLVRSLDELPDELCGGAVSVGNFDGVHRGHARIVQRLVEAARAVGGPAVVFTFDPHPVRLLRPEACPPPLTWTERKAELLSALGVQGMIAYPTDEALLSLSAAEFFQDILQRRLRASALVEGVNFFFGRNREGNVQVLQELCRASGVRLDVVDPLVIDGEVVSSSRVRRLIASGRMDEAVRLLTQPYRIRGLVVHGSKRGARLGFPTANIDAIDTLLPGTGVYAAVAYAPSAPGPQAGATACGGASRSGSAAARVWPDAVDWPRPDDWPVSIAWPNEEVDWQGAVVLPSAADLPGAAGLPDAIAWPAAVHIGPNPTFGERALKVEVHLIGFAGTLYGEPLAVDFVGRVRDIRPFDRVEDLREQLARDVAQARQMALPWLDRGARRP